MLLDMHDVREYIATWKSQLLEAEKEVCELGKR